MPCGLDLLLYLDFSLFMAVMSDELKQCVHFPSRPNHHGRGQCSADFSCGRQQDNARRVSHAPSILPTWPQTQSPGHRTSPACEYSVPLSRPVHPSFSVCDMSTYLMTGLLVFYTSSVLSTNLLSPSLFYRWELWISHNSHSSHRGPEPLMCPSNWSQPMWIFPQRRPLTSAS